ncbi:MAG TPA: class I tRNA ligase family protein, partial [Syntrophorhabdaceae bacterium]|nr:class I tRNA ligase family protein [Syntrophorhabdaceae bacterium]
NATYKYVEKEKSDQASRTFLRGVFENILILLFPFVPHITSEIWAAIRKDAAELGSCWPQYNPEYVIEEKVMVAIQVNGKLRDTFEFDRDTEETVLKETVLTLEKVTKHTEGKQIKKFIVVPNKLVNIVCA